MLAYIPYMDPMGYIKFDVSKNIWRETWRCDVFSWTQKEELVPVICNVTLWLPTASSILAHKMEDDGISSGSHCYNINILIVL